jgi:hypothetical protein
MLKGFRASHPKIGHFGVLVLLNWKQWSNKKMQRTLFDLPLSAWAGHEICLVKCAQTVPRGTNCACIPLDVKMKLQSNIMKIWNPYLPSVCPYVFCTFPQFIILSPSSFVTFPQLIIHCSKGRISFGAWQLLLIFIFFFFSLLGIRLKASHRLSKHSTTELYPLPFLLKRLLCIYKY